VICQLLINSKLVDDDGVVVQRGAKEQPLDTVGHKVATVLLPIISQILTDFHFLDEVIIKYVCIKDSFLCMYCTRV